MIRIVAVTTLVLGLVLSSFAAEASKFGKSNATDMKTRFSVMTFNTENLFDTVDDEDRDDETFLPLAYKQKNRDVMAKCNSATTDYYREQCRETDWNETVLNTKLDRVASVLRNVNGGRGADIVTLVEVENINILNILNEKKLKDLGYQTAVLIEGPDPRGIDNAVLSRYPQWDKAVNHIVPYRDSQGRLGREGGGSRGILEVRLLLPDGTKLAVFAAHFPSQSNPTYLRKQAVAELNRLKANLPKDVIAIAGGDFNITHEENNTHGYISKDLSSEWMVSHLVGCKDNKGTEVYKRTWSFLDLLAFAPALADRGTANWALDLATVVVPEPVADHVNRFGEPHRFNPPATGISDHWPVYAEIYKR